IGLALVIIILMWIMILTLIFLFWRSSRIAAYLLIPYILWVTFASILNYSLLILN
ncbi:tryptophan-rich sensory protein, partial [Candidatus Gracilibacteria bacterium]|nr:tryptophan-rich sensory protein [Candidatus Gracilibacteria bacterium]